MALPIDDYYRRYGPMVLRRCQAMLRDEEAAVDAMQDTFVAVLRRQDTLRDDAPASLLYRTATNVCLNRLRSKRRNPVDTNEELMLNIASLDEPESGTIGRSILDRLFHKEPPSSRTIAQLHLVDGLTLEETAREVGLSVSGVRKRLRVLQEKLQTMEGRTHEAA